MNLQHALLERMIELADTRSKLRVEQDHARALLQSVESKLDQVDVDLTSVWRQLLAPGGHDTPPKRR
jgi:hypothetical protein